MTPEEQLAEFRKQKQLAAFRQMKAAPPVPKVSPPVQQDEGWDMQDTKGLANAVSKGTFGGFADELVGGVRAAIDPLIGMAAGEENATEGYFDNFGDRYEMYRDDQRAVDKEFEKENAGLALAANIVGGIASPINKIMPGVGATGGGLRRAAEAAARGGVEGGIVGLGEAEGTMDEQMKKAYESAMFGSAFGGGVTALGGKLGNIISKKRIKDDLGYGKNFKPANLADPEGSIGKVYRNLVGNAFGGRGTIGRQESQYLRNNPKIRAIMDADTAFPNTLGTGRAVRETKKAITNNSRSARETITDELDTVRNAMPEARDAVRQSRAVAKEAQEAQFAKQRQAIDDVFPSQAVETAMPSSMPEAVKQEIRELDPLAAQERLSRWYSEDGFRMVKDKNFDWDKGFGKRLKSLSEDDPAFALTMGNAAAQVDGLVAKLVREGKKLDDLVPKDFIDELAKGEITGINGDALMAMRNAFAMPANRGGASMKGKNQREVVELFDEFITGQLGKNAKHYTDELEKWPVVTGIRKASDKARKALKNGYTPESLSASMSTGKHTKPARALAKAAAEAKSSVPNKVKVKKVTNKDIPELKGKESALKKARRRVEKTARENKDMIDTESAGILPEDATAWSQMASTAILGVPFGFGVGALPAGAATARTLASPWAQRTVAGQNVWQRALSDAIKKGSTAKYGQGLSRAAVLAKARRDEEEQY